MTRDDLLPFCDPDAGIRYPGTGVPFDVGGYAYATDAQIVARLPRPAGEEVLGGSPAGVPLGIRTLAAWAWFPLPDANALAGVPIPVEPTPDPCRFIVLGMIEQWCEHCGGTGLAETDFEQVEVGGEWFDPKYLRKLTTLPALRSSLWVDGGKRMLLFQSGDLCGAVMALSFGKAAPK